ncbi:MAG: PAS domain-containing protein, partial [Candidatus Sedimenticola endophacoides]
MCKRQALMRSVIASAPIAIWSLDPQGRITFIDGSLSMAVSARGSDTLALRFQGVFDIAYATYRPHPALNIHRHPPPLS